MSLSYRSPPKCVSCEDSVLVSYCSNCKRTRCPKCGERGRVTDVTGIVDDVEGEMCAECFEKVARAKIDEAVQAKKASTAGKLEID